MQITRNALDTTPGPADWFSGNVYIDTIAAAPPLGAAGDPPPGAALPPGGAVRRHRRGPRPPLGAAAVHFTPGARTAWHTHPNGQTIFVTAGVGLCQREGGPIEVIRPGDRVFFEPDEKHWHGAAPTRLMTHIAMQLADESGTPVVWGEHVSDEQYAQAPKVDA